MDFYQKQILKIMNLKLPTTEQERDDLIIILQDMKFEETYKYGDRFVIIGEEYLLAQIKRSKVVLIGITSANRLADAIRVENINKITKKEMEILSGGYEYTKL